MTDTDNMTAKEFLSAAGRKGGQSRSRKKLRAIKRNARRPKPGVSAWWKTVREHALSGTPVSQDQFPGKSPAWVSRLAAVVKDYAGRRGL